MLGFAVAANALRCGAQENLEPAVVRDLDVSVLLETRMSLRRGEHYLTSRQLPDGSWGRNPIVTSLAAVAVANGPGPTDRQRDACVDRACDYIVSQTQADGGVWNERTRQYPTYSTAISLLALVRSHREQDAEVVDGGRRYLLTAQHNAPDNAATIDAQCRGGFSSNSNTRPDLTTTQWALYTLYLTDYLDRPQPHGTKNRRPAADAYDRALAFIVRCQNTKGEHKGRFRDLPVGVAAEQPSADSRTPCSDAFLTFAGLESLIYANVPLADTRVQSALRWTSRHHTVKENPGLGATGHYTYLYNAARALRAVELAGATALPVPLAGWRRDMATQLLATQQATGAWTHKHAEWAETHPELVTAYAMLTLELAVGAQLNRD